MAGRAQRSRLAVAGSVAAHVAVFLALFWHFGSTPQPASLDVMTVALVRPPRPERPQPSTLAPDKAVASSAHSPEADRHTTPDVPSPPFMAPPLPLTPNNETNVGVRAVLKGLLGCDQAKLVGLSQAEREDCRDRLARKRTAEIDAPPPKLNLDKRGDYAAKNNPEAWLNRRPTNGCKVRAAGDVAPSGKEGAAAGVGCALPF